MMVNSGENQMRLNRVLIEVELAAANYLGKVSRLWLLRETNLGEEILHEVWGEILGRLHSSSFLCEAWFLTMGSGASHLTLAYLRFYMDVFPNYDRYIGSAHPCLTSRKWILILNLIYWAKSLTLMLPALSLGCQPLYTLSLYYKIM